MEEIITLINNKSEININSPKNIKLSNNFNNRSLSFKNINEVDNSQAIIKEMQSSIDSIMNNLRNNSPSFNLSKKYLQRNNSHLYKTPNNMLTRKIYNNDNNKSPNILNYRIKKNINQNLVKLKNNLKIDIFKNNLDYKVNSKINNNIIYNSKNKINLINDILQQIKLIKNNNKINKKEIFIFKKEYYEMEKMLIKGVGEYFK